jgi:uncharacterized membrane protein
VYLAFSEIRNCGSNNLQIVQRMRAMIENLVHTLPAEPSRRAASTAELLDREVERIFTIRRNWHLLASRMRRGLGGHSGKVTQWVAS